MYLVIAICTLHIVFHFVYSPVITYFRGALLFVTGVTWITCAWTKQTSQITTMSFRRKLCRSEPIRVNSVGRTLRGHALLIRFLERRGLGDCAKYFPDEMTLGMLRTTNPRELMLMYNVQDAADRERLMHAIESYKKEEMSSDGELSEQVSLYSACWLAHTYMASHAYSRVPNKRSCMLIYLDFFAVYTHSIWVYTFK